MTGTKILCLCADVGEVYVHRIDVSDVWPVRF